ncbi:unnamed protein product [Clavelina lepadiformis]|uniref:Uncharacterized protein n=1 Tax=Clavelina lepadiformis TaxID=159417 RepID=A0ABP0FS72_CLALP
MMKTFYVIKWILGNLLFLLLLDLVIESAVVAPNQKGNQDGTKLSEQRFLPETSPVLYVEEENHATELTQISRKRVKRQGPALILKKALIDFKCGNGNKKQISCSCLRSRSSPFYCLVESCNNDPLKVNWMANCRKQVMRKCQHHGETTTRRQAICVNKSKQYLKGLKTTERLKNSLNTVTSTLNEFVSADKGKICQQTILKLRESALSDSFMNLATAVRQ